MAEYVISDNTYRLHYTIGRIEMIEKAADTSIMSVMGGMGSGKMPSISVLRMLFAYGMMDENGKYAHIKKALDFAEEELKEHGYNAMLTAVLETLQEDCGFLFLSA